MATKKQLEERIVQLETELASALELNEKAMAALAAAHAAIAERDARIASLEERFARLEARLMGNSTNSHVPPSKNPLHAPKRGRSSRPTGKPPGGRPGHEPHTFAAIEPEAVTRRVDCDPAVRCDYCLADLSDAPLALGEDAKPFFLLDLPKLALDVTEYRRPRRACDHCQRHTVAPLPAGVGPSPFGPGLVAFIATLTIRYRLGRRPVAALLADLFGRRISPAAIQSALETASEAISEAVAELIRAVEEAPVAGSDETGWRDQSGFAAGKRAWLWVATTSIGTVYAIAPDRGIAGSLTVLGAKFQGVVSCDRWRPYRSRFGHRRQLCWAHLAREATGAQDRGAILAKMKHVRLVATGEELVTWGEQFEAITDQLFNRWHAFERGELDRPALVRELRPVRLAAARLILRGTRALDKKLAATCRDISKQFGRLWTFVAVEGVSPTNNVSERELRGAVIARGLMLSTKSAAGRLLFTRLLTASATCRKQGRDLLNFLRVALERRAHGLSPPSLVPT